MTHFNFWKRGRNIGIEMIRKLANKYIYDDFKLKKQHI